MVTDREGVTGMMIGNRCGNSDEDMDGNGFRDRDGDENKLNDGDGNGTPEVARTSPITANSPEVKLNPTIIGKLIARCGDFSLGRSL